MIPCSECYEQTAPDCIDYLYIDGFFDIGTTYIVEIENHFGKKTSLEVTGNYGAMLVIDVTDLPDGYFFRGNTYVFRVYESEENQECALTYPLCGYQDCLSVTFYQGEETEWVLRCC